MQSGRTWRRLDGRLSLGLESKHGKSGVEAKEEEDMEGGNGVHRASSASLILGGWLVGTLVTCCQLQEWRQMEVADWLVATAKDGCV